MRCPECGAAGAFTLTRAASVPASASVECDWRGEPTGPAVVEVAGAIEAAVADGPTQVECMGCGALFDLDEVAHEAAFDRSADALAESA